LSRRISKHRNMISQRLAQQGTTAWEAVTP
jgi:hypothetical protein